MEEYSTGGCICLGMQVFQISRVESCVQMSKFQPHLFYIYSRNIGFPFLIPKVNPVKNTPYCALKYGGYQINKQINKVHRINSLSFQLPVT